MCGIAGIFDRSGNAIQPDRLHHMDVALTSRGPDGHGEFIKGCIGIANRRLAIIDPRTTGNQPLVTDDARYAITFNGEIYNFRQIRHLLEKKGYPLKTHTDTETILYGYAAWGPRIVEKLIGQFAFCIVDIRQQQLFLARDRVGINPLFYANVGTLFLFASEIKGLLASGYVKKEIDSVSLQYYLSMFCIPASRTICKHAHMLLPGTTLTVSKDHHVIHSYYRIPLYGMPELAPSDDVTVSTDEMSLSPVHQECRISIQRPADMIKQVKKTVMQSVVDAMVSDVPIGVFLSGGIDSSIVAACMAEASDMPIKTFSLWSDAGDAFDERPYARAIVKKYKTDHEEATVTDKDVVSSLPLFIRGLDQPSGGSLESYFVSKLASKKVRVALSGIGGDELFGGYHADIYRYARYRRMYSRVPSLLRTGIRRLIGAIPIDQKVKRSWEIAESFLSQKHELAQRLSYYITFSDAEIQMMMSESVSDHTAQSFFSDLWSKTEGIHPIDRLSYVDLCSYTRDDLLLGMNMVSMAHSLEVRVPLLDHRIVSISAQIPPSWKYHPVHGGKYILKQAFSDMLPQEVLTHKKVGFGLPRVRYMRGALKPYITDILSRKSIVKRGLFNPDMVQKEITWFYNQPEDAKLLWKDHIRLWSLFKFELWMREFFDA